jgi:glyoxylase-like metal-dependent hydrolase (beta-lactamase superfamily II)
MTTTQISSHSYQLTRFGFVNCYLVREDDGFTLVDTGMLSSTAALIIEEAARLKTPIRRILLTHAHTDHVGSVDALLSKLGSHETELISNERSLPILKTPPDLSMRPGEAPGKIKGGTPGIKSKPTRLLIEGDMVGSLKCIDTPGHIPGHMSFLDERDGTLFAGDALVAMGRLNVSNHTPWFFPFPKFVTWNAEVAIASAEKLLDYTIETFACGHGPIRSGGMPELRDAIVRAKQSA